jgi:hypothetical protein
MTDTSITGIATEVATVDEAIMKFLPEISLLLGFIPGAGVAVPFLPEVLTALDNAAKAVATGNPGAAIGSIFSEIANHLTPGAPNSPTLSG